MSNNFYCFDISGKGDPSCTCPGPNVGPGFREITDYRPHFVMNSELIAQAAASQRRDDGCISARDDEYRLYLQQNGAKIWRDRQVEYSQKYNCMMNSCIPQQKRIVVHPSVFVQEHNDYNAYMQRQKINKCPDYQPFNALMLFKD